MLKNSEELESMMCNILVKINKGEKISNIIPETCELEGTLRYLYTLGITLQISADNIPMPSQQGIPRLSDKGLKFIEDFHMNLKDLTNIQKKFNFLSDELLKSTERNFNANLCDFKKFCASEKILIDILEPISKIILESPDNNSENYMPKNHNESLKESYDVILNNKTDYNTIWVHAKSNHLENDNISELFEIGKSELFSSFIKYINLKLSEKIDNLEKPIANVVPNQINYTIQNASNSIIGNSQNATINNGLSFDEITKIIQSKNIDSSDKEQLIELTKYVKKLAENNTPMNKGLLSKFSDIVSKHSWVPSLIGSALIKYFIV